MAVDFIQRLHSPTMPRRKATRLILDDTVNVPQHCIARDNLRLPKVRRANATTSV
jgi:hypothetical protein